MVVSALMRLASTVLWFENGVDVDPPYNIILSSFRQCLDPNGALYRGMRNRVFISGKATVQIVISECSIEAKLYGRPDPCSNVDHQQYQCCVDESTRFVLFIAPLQLRVPAGMRPGSVGCFVSPQLVIFSWNPLLHRQQAPPQSASPESSTLSPFPWDDSF